MVKCMASPPLPVGCVRLSGVRSRFLELPRDIASDSLVERSYDRRANTVVIPTAEVTPISGRLVGQLSESAMATWRGRATERERRWTTDRIS